MALDLLDSLILWILCFDGENDATIENLNYPFIMTINDLWNYYRIENLIDYLSIFVCVL